MSYAGACHCGAQRLRLDTALTLADWPLRRCACDFCRRHQPRYTADPAGRLLIGSGAALIRYRFGLRRADFLICSVCGCYLGAIRADDDGPRMVLNANLLAIAEHLPTDPTIMDYDGEVEADRDSRQRTRWTPVEVR